jgi:hypothetical protein
MSTPIRLLILLLAWSLSAPLLAESNYDIGKKYWHQANYRKAYYHLSNYRGTSLYGRNAEVDYMLGTSGCRLSDLRIWGGNVLDWILRRYALSQQSRIIVQQQLALCRSNRDLGTVEGPAISSSIETLFGAIARASGKSVHLSENGAVNYYSAQSLREIPREIMEARLVQLGQYAQVKRIIKLQAPKFDVHVFDRFVIVTNTAEKPEVLNETARNLYRYIKFIERTYGIVLPPYYVTIYLVETQSQLRELANKLHGMEVGGDTRGYSFRDDMSILAVVPNLYLGLGAGTLMHELFHLTVRSRFGDIPPWLDEGIASLYEDSFFDGDKVVGLPNWRGPILRQLESKRPTIQQLVARDWFAFEQPEMAPMIGKGYIRPPSAPLMAVTLATARYFILYLQEQGKLMEVYETLRNQQPSRQDNQDVAAQTTVAIERVLGKNISSIDSDFLTWFRSIKNNKDTDMIYRTNDMNSISIIKNIN